MTDDQLKHVLNPNIEPVVEEEPKKKKPKKKEVVKTVVSANRYDEALYQGNEFDIPLNKYKKSAAKFFDTTIEHLGNIATLLNGRKIDGFLTNELIGRLGFFDLNRMNRTKVAEMKNSRDGSNSASAISVDMATEKLKDMIHSDDPLIAYTNYVEGYQNISNKQINDEAGMGS